MPGTIADVAAATRAGRGARAASDRRRRAGEQDHRPDQRDAGLGGGSSSATWPDPTPGARYSRHARHGTGRGARTASAATARASCARSMRGSPHVRLVTDPSDLDPYRRDETAYLARRPAARRRVSRVDRRRRRAGPAVRRVRRPDRSARSRHGALGRCGGHRGRPDDLVHAHGQDPRDRCREPHGHDPARGHQRDAQGGGGGARRCSTRRTRPRSSRARSAATSGPTRAGCAA